MIKDTMVVPLALAIAHIGETVEHLYPGHYLHEIINTKLFSGIKLDSKKDMILKATEVSNADGMITVECKLNTKSGARNIPAYSCNVVLGVKKPSTPAFLDADLNDHGLSWDAKRMYDGYSLSWPRIPATRENYQCYAK